MFHDVRAYNRGNLAGYREVYVQAPKEVLIARNQKGLYSGVMDQTTRHVAGIDVYKRQAYPGILQIAPP